MPGDSLWRNHRFVRLFAAHVVSLVGSGLSSVALGLLAHQLVGASASAVLGITLTIRVVVIVACDTANILAPSLAALTITTCGFRRNFVMDALTFLVSSALIFRLPRLATASQTATQPVPLTRGISTMLRRWPLRETLYLALQVGIAGGFVLVATVSFVKGQLALPDTAYTWAMAACGIGSVLGAAVYGIRRALFHAATQAICGSHSCDWSQPTHNFRTERTAIATVHSIRPVTISHTNIATVTSCIPTLINMEFRIRIERGSRF